MLYRGIESVICRPGDSRLRWELIWVETYAFRTCWERSLRVGAVGGTYWFDGDSHRSRLELLFIRDHVVHSTLSGLFTYSRVSDFPVFLILELQRPTGVRSHPSIWATLHRSTSSFITNSAPFTPLPYVHFKLPLPDSMFVSSNFPITELTSVLQNPIRFNSPRTRALSSPTLSPFILSRTLPTVAWGVIHVVHLD